MTFEEWWDKKVAAGWIMFIDDEGKDIARETWKAAYEAGVDDAFSTFPNGIQEDMKPTKEKRYDTIWDWQKDHCGCIGCCICELPEYLKEML